MAVGKALSMLAPTVFRILGYFRAVTTYTEVRVVPTYKCLPDVLIRDVT